MSALLKEFETEKKQRATPEGAARNTTPNFDYTLCDADEVRRFLSLVRPDGGELTIICFDSAVAGVGPKFAKTFALPNEQEPLLSTVRAQCERKRNVYWVVNESHKPDAKPTKLDMAAALFAWADCDPKPGSEYPSSRAYLIGAHAAKLASVASFVIDSGNGIQAFFRLARPVNFGDGFDEYERINDLIGKKFEGPSVANCDRIMRMPGTWNWPTPAKLKKGYPQEGSMARILTESECVYELDDLKALAVGDATLDRAADYRERFNSILKVNRKLRERYLNGSSDGMKDPSGSAMDMSMVSMLKQYNFSLAEIREILEPWPFGGSGRSQGERYWQRCYDSAVELGSTEYMERRREQQRKNVALQSEGVTVNPPMASVDEMVDDLVWVADGKGVMSVSNPHVSLCYSDFADLTAASVSITQVNGREKVTLNAELWKRHESRKTVLTRTFRAGAPIFTTNPEGRTAANTWRPIERRESTRDVTPFLEQVTYLFPDDIEREKFLDWLAHIEQRPGELPHYGWLHIATRQGCGRNWIACLVSRVWKGYVAPSVDLTSLLEGSFNGQLAGKLLAQVDEIREGGDGSHKHAQRLKSLVNEPVRYIKPKYGREYIEFNSCRWLVFSNHENAIPLADNDRRWRVVTHNLPQREPAVYEHLYGLLDDAEFVNSVGVWLAQRDISTFNPGERPPMTAAKLKAVNASKPTIVRLAEELVRAWPADIIANEAVANCLSEGNESKGISPAMRNAMTDAGAVSFEKPVKIDGTARKVWILRNADSWRACTSPQLLSREAMNVPSEHWGTAHMLLMHELSK